MMSMLPVMLLETMLTQNKKRKLKAGIYRMPESFSLSDVTIFDEFESLKYDEF